MNKYEIYRKTKESQTWSSVYATVPGTDSSYTDVNVTDGQSFEYYVLKFKTSTSVSALGYIWAGINFPESHNKGTIILLVDKAYIPALDNDIRQLELDMIGDGWQIIRHNVSRTDTVASIRKMIKNDYTSNQGVTAVFLLGRIPVPYSGLLSIPPDGHVVGSGNHTGAWPADAYYAELNGSWTDWGTDTTGNRKANWNLPGDGKPDQNMIASSVELQIGRVDMFNMPAFSANDTLLMKRYLDKNHKFKMGNTYAAPRGLIDDNFTSLNLTAQAWRGFASMFGPENIHADKDYFPTLRDSSYLWSCGAGAGSYTSCNGIGNSTNFVQDSLRNVFTMLTGSFFGDWDNANNLLRAPLASKGITLASFWGGIPQWHIHHMALGENLGFCTKLTMNNDVIYYTGNFNLSTREIHIALMGDPTLRMHVVKPVSNVKTTAISGNTQVNITWQASTDNVVGYNIYRARTLNGQFSKINDSWITTTSYTDTFPWDGTNVYHIRAVKLETSASGSYYNMSIGVLDSTQAVNTAINDMIAGNINLNIYPNPSQGRFSLTIESSRPADLNCEIINSLGKTIYSDHYQVSGAVTRVIDLGSVEKGIYIIKVSGKNTNVVKQLIIQ
jgi:hypothetical protein